MKKYLLFTLLATTGILCFGQNKHNERHIVSPDNVKANAKHYIPYHTQTGTGNKNLALEGQAPKAGTVARITAFQPLGSASNVFTIVTTEQNQVFVNNSLNTVGFIHRNNANFFGGSSGNLRYDLSIDGGASFCNDNGPLNPVMSTPARYPNAAFYNPLGNTDPFAATIIGYGPTVGSSWLGEVDFATSVSCQSPIVHDEQYGVSYPDVFNGGGFCEGENGVFWNTMIEKVGADSALIRVFKRTAGNYPMSIVQSGNIAFQYATTTAPAMNPNIAFGPDPSIGYIATLADLPGGQDSALYPVFLKTTDYGATWSAPINVDLNSFPWIADTLQAFWETSPGVPASSGIATTGFDFDLTVDVNGNPHMVVVVGSFSPGQPYAFAGSLEKFLADITSDDGGSTWRVEYLSPILTFRTLDFGTTTTISMDNNPQISRSEDGNFIFYSWADSDTSEFTGSQNGIGFGESGNLAPNLRVAGLRVSTGERSYPQLVTDEDLLWEGRALFPTMAPIVLDHGSECFRLPIVAAEMPTMDPLNETFFHYLGNEITVCASTFCLPEYMDLGWLSFSTPGITPPCITSIISGDEAILSLDDAFPNPSNERVIIGFDLPFATEISIDLFNIYGQKVAAIVNGEYAHGHHQIEFNTYNLANGIYFYQLKSDAESVSKRLIVNH